MKKMVCVSVTGPVQVHEVQVRLFFTLCTSYWYLSTKYSVHCTVAQLALDHKLQYRFLSTINGWCRTLEEVFRFRCHLESGGSKKKRNRKPNRNRTGTGTVNNRFE